MSQIDRDKPIERVSSPQPDTEERSVAAEIIEREWDKDTTLTEMANMSDYSRQHFVNVIDSHFRYVESEKPEPEEMFEEEETVEVPRSIIDDPKAREAFVRGFDSAYRLCSN